MFKFLVREWFRSSKSYLRKNQTVGVLCVTASPLIFWAGSYGFSIFKYDELIKHPHRVTCILEDIGCVDEPVVKKPAELKAREKRFIAFASVEFDDQLFMTPEDFLDSMLYPSPRPRIFRASLTEQYVKDIVKNTPPLAESNDRLFRDLRERGIISYAEYLFLLALMTQPQNGFCIAYAMLDRQNTGSVSKEEFQDIDKVLSNAIRKKRGRNEATLDEPPQEKIKIDRTVTKCYNNFEYHLSHHTVSEMLVDDTEGLQRRHKVETTLQTHFFGRDNKSTISCEQFKQFINNLRHEILELEFQSFARGKTTISEVTFARALLQHTYLNEETVDAYIRNMQMRLKPIEQGITFQEYYDFFYFLNNLEDFKMAIRLYTLSDVPISKSEFSRGVRICTGTRLTRHVVNVVFNLFDLDGDGYLNYKEFINVMRDRFHRGIKHTREGAGWMGFKNCMRSELRSNAIPNTEII